MMRRNTFFFSFRFFLLIILASLWLNEADGQAVTDPTRLWANGVVPYVIDSRYTTTERQIILSGINEYTKYTCIKLIPRTNQADYVIFLGNGTGCNAHIGFQGNVHVVSLSSAGGCVKKAKVIHELMHVIGFTHEHQRDDRDNYITVSNLQPQWAFALAKSNPGEFKTFNTGYDYDSVMHYQPFSIFAVDYTLPIIMRKKPTDTCLMFGNDDNGFTQTDTYRINRLYNCPTPKQKPAAIVRSCVDKDTNCAYWAQNNVCTTNLGFMILNCIKSCSVDKNPNCPILARTGECVKNPGYMLYNCLKSCNTCVKC